MEKIWFVSFKGGRSTQRNPTLYSLSTIQSQLVTYIAYTCLVPVLTTRIVVVRSHATHL